MGRKNRRKKIKASSEVAVKDIKTKPNYATDYTLVIPGDIYQKIQHWMHMCDKEVSGFGSLSFDEKTSTYTVTDAILLKQVVGAAETEIDPHALGKAMFRLKDEPNALKWHWHSHVDMGVFWSADDMEIIRSLGQQGWIFATVFNRKDEMKSAFYTTTTVMGKPHDIFIDNVATSVIYYYDSEVIDAWTKEYKDNVTEKSYYPRSSHSYGGSPVKVLDPDTEGWRTWGSNTKPDEDKEKKSGYHSGKLAPGFDDDDDEEMGGVDFMDLSEEFELSGHPYSLLTHHDYDEQGLVRYADGCLYYNPARDQELKDNRIEQFEALSDMPQDEIEFLQMRDSIFAKLVQDYITYKAKIGD